MLTNPLKIETGVDGDVSSLKSWRLQSWTLRDCKVLEVASQRCQRSKLLEAQVELRYIKHTDVETCQPPRRKHCWRFLQPPSACRWKGRWKSASAVPGTRYSPALPARVPSTDQGWGLTGHTAPQFMERSHSDPGCACTLHLERSFCLLDNSALQC